MDIKKILKDIKKSIIAEKDFTYLETTKEKFYPINLEFTLEDEDFYYTPKDHNGVPQRKYESVGLTYNPTRIASYSLAYWNRYKADRKDIDLIKFNKGVDWFVNNHENGIWYYKFDWNKLKSPWLSGMAQGQAISVLVRAYENTNNSLYKEICLKAIEPFEKTIKEGGVLSYLKEDVFFEEYPTQNPTHVLNGFLFSVIGLIELLNTLDKIDKDYERVKKLIKLALTSLENNIERWDNGYWSVYDLGNEKKKIQNTCTISYHSLQISQLKYIGNELNNEKIVEISKRWDKYTNSFYKRIKSLLIKIIYRYKNQVQR